MKIELTNDDKIFFKNKQEDNSVTSSYINESQYEPVNTNISSDKPEFIEQTIISIFDNIEKTMNNNQLHNLQ